MAEINTSSPTRIDLCGGTLDLWPFYSFFESAITINFSIDIYTYCKIIPNDSYGLHAESIDFHKSFSSLEEYLSHPDNKKDFFYPFLKHFQPKSCHIYISSESPVGAGLGGSSSLSISLVKALEEFTGKTISDIHQKVKLTHNLESYLLQAPAGTQDYYPPCQAGLLAIHYRWDRTDLEDLSAYAEFLKDQFLLVYTGKPHHSGLNNWQVMKALIEKDSNTWDCLAQIKSISEKIYQCILAKDFTEIPEHLKQEYKYRCQLSDAFVSEEIRDLERISKDFVQAIKICGAGGGGCVMLLVEPSKKQKLIERLKDSPYEVLHANYVGAE